MEKYVFHLGMTVLLGLLAYIWQGNSVKLTELDKSLNLLRLEIVEVKASMLSKQDVQELIGIELAKRGIK